MTPRTKLGRVLCGIDWHDPCCTVESVDATVSHYAQACGGLTVEEQQDVANLKAELGKQEAGRARK